MKIEFRRRLKRLKRALDYSLDHDKALDLFPALFSVFSYLWGNPHNKVIDS